MARKLDFAGLESDSGSCAGGGVKPEACGSCGGRSRTGDGVSDVPESGVAPADASREASMLVLTGFSRFELDAGVRRSIAVSLTAGASTDILGAGGVEAAEAPSRTFFLRDFLASSTTKGTPFPPESCIPLQKVTTGPSSFRL